MGYFQVCFVCCRVSESWANFISKRSDRIISLFTYWTAKQGFASKTLSCFRTIAYDAANYVIQFPHRRMAVRRYQPSGIALATAWTCSDVNTDNSYGITNQEEIISPFKSLFFIGSFLSILPCFGSTSATAPVQQTPAMLLNWKAAPYDPCCCLLCMNSHGSAQCLV